MQNNQAPEWAVTICASLDRTERIYRQGEAQARGGWSRLANPYNNDSSLAGIWARGWDAGDTATTALIRRWREADKGVR